MVSLNEISLKKWQDENLEYLRYEYDLKPHDQVLDIGSYRQEWADEIRKKFSCKVECFDALDNKAAWTHNGRIILGGQFYYSSAFDTSNQREFSCVDIAEYMDRDIALCKINIEGMEYELIEYIIKKGLIGNIDQLQVQFHLIDEETEKLYEQLANKLSKTHTLTWRYPFVWENWKRND